MTAANRPATTRSVATPDRSGTRAGADVGQTRGTAPTPDDAEALAVLRTLPSIGPRLAEKLLLLGVHAPADLHGRDPEVLYDELQSRLGPVDRCVLYAFRCAVHAAEHAADDGSAQGGVCGGDSGGGDPELAKWWNWRDGGPAVQRIRAAGE